ncbi:hypothetical protein [Streptomyces sp. bgisy095]|uniref:hypothetical protein n=1 Tax=unclassified Streptomyces TaxID=2593676 RepID=UPI003D764ED6
MRSTTTESIPQHNAETEANRGAAPAGERLEQTPSWKDRPYGAKTDEQLADAVRAFLREAIEQDTMAAKTREDYETLRERLEREGAECLTMSQKRAGEAGIALDTAVAHLRTAIEEAGRVRWGPSRRVRPAPSCRTSSGRWTPPGSPCVSRAAAGRRRSRSSGPATSPKPSTATPRSCGPAAQATTPARAPGAP